ncbi:hypothetical protein HIM_03786 [Hirsutella minnesotensis 3608]|uniref:Uncharacterized protein n=1 Tax=Hirsutella minnesotensis 3608 TaxID=1043627 RepID=A0A0F8A6D9_9HYPO|nr:hypothetical protein HIM_03786 [Hirsutella minnesotensis 3608]
MKHSLLECLVFVAGVSGQATSIVGKALTHYNARQQAILAAVQYDPASPATSQEGKHVPACYSRRIRGFNAWSQTCSDLYFDGGLDMVGRPADVSVFAERAPENLPLVNAGAQVVDITTTKMIRKYSKLTTGWKVTAEATGTVASMPMGGASLAVKVSGEYSSLTEKGEETTDTFTMKYPCPADSVCSVETWTWHIKFQGSCERRKPSVTCQWKTPLCPDESGSIIPICSEETDFIKQQCNDRGVRPCEMAVPVSTKKQVWADRVFLVAPIDSMTPGMKMMDMPLSSMNITVIEPREG